MARSLPAPAPASGGLAAWVRILTESDLLLAFGVLGILVVLIVPVPSLLLDMMLACSITFSVLVLLTALFIDKPLQFSAFPTILLIATMLRLALNLASTRLILADGHDGPAAAGNVIEAFGGFVMQDNVVIGLIVFAILVIVNFVVITKGSGRIAEVAARFSLDAMPGKQMAIDADLSAGLIDESAARERRKQLEEESAFFGAMDGAAKFVRGDAIAGLLITAINLVGGLVIGVGQMGIGLVEASRTYSLLTIGDGLVSQIPALIVSTAAGLLVSKAGVTGRADLALFGQLGAFPRALAVTGGLMVVLALVPGLPLVPFLTLGGVAGWLAWSARGRAARAAATALAEDRGEASGGGSALDDPVTAALEVDTLRLELGYGLLPLIGAGDGGGLPDQIKALRRQLAQELGFVLPSVRIQDNIQLPPNTYVLRIKEAEVARGELRTGMLLVMDPHGRPIDLPGEATTEPTFGLAASWIGPHLREQAIRRGLTVVDPATVVTTHLTEIVRENLSELLSFAETQKLLRGLPEEYQKLLSELVPARLPATAIHRVLQALLGERVSIRDLALIVEAISEATVHATNVRYVTEHVRAKLARQISMSVTGITGAIPLLLLAPEWERAFHEALDGPAEERRLAMAPDRLQAFVAALREAFEAQAAKGELPVLMTAPAIRPHVRAIVERVRPATTVLSQNEIHPKAKLKTLGAIAMA